MTAMASRNVGTSSSRGGGGRSAGRNAPRKGGLEYWFGGGEAGSPGGSSSANTTNRSFRDIVCAGGNIEQINWYNRAALYLESTPRDGRVEMPKLVTLNDLPKGMKKSGPSDQNMWVSSENFRRIQSYARALMIMVLRDYIKVNDAELQDGKSLEECIIWYEEGILPGSNITEAFNYYSVGQVCNNFAISDNFVDVQNHINNVLKEKRNKVIR